MTAEHSSAPKGPRAGWLTLLALLGVALTVSLGVWQLDRAAQKQLVQDRIGAVSAAPPLDGQALRGLTVATTGPDGSLADALHHPVDLRGRWLPAHTVFLDNRPMDRQAGFIVLTPLALEEVGWPAVVLVQRGWAPRHASDRTALPPIDTPEGVVQVQGRTLAEPTRAYQLGEPGSGRIRQNVDLAAFRAETGLPLLPLAVLQTGADSEGLRRHWPAPTAGIDKHYGYAFQWFGMATVIALLYVWFQVFRPAASSA